MLPATLAARRARADAATSSRSSARAPALADVRASSARPTRGARASSSSATSTRPRGCTKPVQRLWISSLTPEAIAAGLSRPATTARDYDALGRAARGAQPRRLARGHEPVARVQHRARRRCSPWAACRRRRWRWWSRASRRSARSSPRTTSRWSPTFVRAGATRRTTGTVVPRRAPQAAAPSERARLPTDGEVAAAIVERVRDAGEARIESVERETHAHAAAAALRPHRAAASRQPPLRHERPAHARRRAGALRDAEAPQLSAHRQPAPLADVADDAAPSASSAIAGPLPRRSCAEGPGERPLGPRFVDDAKVADHHAIIPTTDDARRPTSTGDERRIYDLVCRRLLSAWHDDHVYAVDQGRHRRSRRRRAIDDRFAERRSLRSSAPHRASRLEGARRRRRQARRGREPPEPARRARAKARRRASSTRRPSTKQTRPPPRFTDATLLTAHGDRRARRWRRRRSSDAMKESGLGTPATRAAIIETLLKREYVVREGKSLEATDKGIALIDVVHADVKSPAMTGEWEAELERDRARRRRSSTRSWRGSRVTCARCDRRERAAERPADAVRAPREGSRAALRDATQARLWRRRAPPREGRGARIHEHARIRGPIARRSCARRSASRRSAVPGRSVSGGDARATTCCWSCRPAPASRSATSSRAGARRHDAGGEPAHRADGGPGREAAARSGSRAERIHSGRVARGVARRVPRLPRRASSTSCSSRPSG